jgi:SET domain-containing protein
MRSVIVKKSKINKKGVFANKNFKKGEVVLKWHPKKIKKSDVEKLPDSQKHYIDKVGKSGYFLMRAPEKFVNHSCSPNTKTKNFSDIAIRNIRKGEEITTNYGKSNLVPFKCKCGSKNCKKTIK